MTVLKAHQGNNANSSLQTSNKNTSNQSKLSANTQSKSDASTVAASTSANTSLSTSAKPATAQTKTTTSAKSNITPTPTASQAASNSSTPATDQSPLSVLTTLITSMDSGASATVTASSVSVPGPISTAQARPIVFTANGQTYFAYTQGHAPNFNLTPSQTANTMAIVSATVSGPTLTSAHLDKSNNLVDPNFQVVGYSTSGN